jgi:hypothetical protein
VLRRNFWRALTCLIPSLATKAETPRVTPLKAYVGTLREQSRPKLRVWKLGNLEHKVMPTDTTMQRLADILTKWDGTSDLDLIWDPSIEVQQLDVTDNTVDIILPVDATVETKATDDTEMKATVTVNPQIRIIKREG